VYVSPTDLGYDLVLEGWLRYRKSGGRADESDKLAVILKKYLINMRFIEMQAKECKEPMMEMSAVIMVINILNLLTGCL
jgi:dynein heavy chain